VDAKTALDVHIRCDAPVALDFAMLTPFIGMLAGLGKLECGPAVTKPPQSASHVHPEFEAYVSLRGLIDVPAEIKRLEKQLAEKRKHLQSALAKLDNKNFTDKAPPEVVQQQRDLVTDLQKQIQVMEDNLHALQQE
jgi:valyl-tRNA synthetase